jgi:hypothetical protein
MPWDVRQHVFFAIENVNYNNIILIFKNTAVRLLDINLELLEEEKYKIIKKKSIHLF